MKIAYCNHVISLIPVLEEWRKESDGNEFGIMPSVEKTASHLQSMIENQNCKVLIMFGDDGKAVGFMGIAITNNPVADGKIASEHLWYVIPSCRGKGLSLLRAGRIWAKENGCTHFMTTVSRVASKLHDSTCSIYERMGMKQIETTFICSL